MIDRSTLPEKGMLRRGDGAEAEADCRLAGCLCLCVSHQLATLLPLSPSAAHSKCNSIPVIPFHPTTISRKVIMILFAALPLSLLCLLDALAVAAANALPNVPLVDRSPSLRPRSSCSPDSSTECGLGKRAVAANASKTIMTLGLSADGRCVFSILVQSAFS